MDYSEQDNGASGSIPEFGAIFMSNIETKRECFKRKIFALLSFKAEFVKHIKAGMVLFLFEFKKRELFGVYQASSDGAMDIVPHAFNYLGKRLPAQVCFTLIWHCDPLSEKEFRDAIRENYFSPKKFNFGLSEDQVRRLLYLFSSRKLKKKMPPHPLSEATVGVAGKDRRLVGDDRLESSERGYMEDDDFNLAVLRDYHVNLVAGAEEDEVLIDDGFDTEEKVYPFAREDFLAKRRRIGNDDRLMANYVTENGIYNHGIMRTFPIGSPKDSLDEIRKLANARRLLTVERVNEKQVDKILNPVLSSEYLVDPLDVRANDDYSFMQMSRLFDEYNARSGSWQAFASDRYQKSLDESKHAIDDDRLLLDDGTQGNYNIHDVVKPMGSGGGNLNSCRQARETTDDHECLMNRKLENRYPMDCDSSCISAFEPSASFLHNKIRKTTAAGRFPINESEPNFGTCSVEGFSSENLSHPMQCGRRIIDDQKYPIVEGRLTENMADNILHSVTLAKNAGHSTSVDRRVGDDGRFRKSKRIDSEEDSCMYTNLGLSTECPSFSQLKQELSSFSDKKLPEKGFSQFTVSHKFDLSRTFNHATITRVVPYLPEHPSFSYGCSASIAPNQYSSLVRENHPHHGSPGNFYFLSEDRSPRYFSQLEKTSRPLDIAHEFGNKGFPTGAPGHQSTLLHESTSSFVRPTLSVHMDLSTSALVNYRGSLFSKLSPPCINLENIEGEKGLFACPSKSRENHFAFDGNLPTTSQHVSKHVPQHEMDMLAGKDFSVGIRRPERDLESHKNQYFRFSSNINLEEPHKISEAPHVNSNFNRRSVFTRLTSGEESWLVEERNDIDFNHHDCCIDATADEVMEILQQGNNLSLRKLRKSRGVGQPTNGKNAVDQKKTRCHIETDHSTREKRKLNDASVAIANGMDEVPKETRIVDFKRRSDRKKILLGITADSAAHDKTTGANEEVKRSSMETTLKCKKLVRPVFTKTESATDPRHSNETLQVPAPILDKDDKQSCKIAISICEAKMPNDNIRLSNMLASRTDQPMDCSIKEHQNPEEQKDVVAHVLPSTNPELNEHETTIVDLQIGRSQVIRETTQKESFGIQASVQGILAKDIETTIIGLNLPESSVKGFKLGAGCETYFERNFLRRLEVKQNPIKTNKSDMESSQ